MSKEKNKKIQQEYMEAISNLERKLKIHPANAIESYMKIIASWMAAMRQDLNTIEIYNYIVEACDQVLDSKVIEKGEGKNGLH